MDEFQTLKYRWGICKERKAVIGVSVAQILSDIQFLLKRIEDLEHELAESLNPVSSAVGQVTLIEDGVLHYMINGKYLPIDAISAAVTAAEEKKAKKPRKKKAKTNEDETK